MQILTFIAIHLDLKCIYWYFTYYTELVLKLSSAKRTHRLLMKHLQKSIEPNMRLCYFTHDDEFIPAPAASDVAFD